MENTNEHNQILVVVEYSDDIDKSPSWVTFDAKSQIKISAQNRKVEQRIEVETDKEIPVKLLGSLSHRKSTDPYKGIFAETTFTFEKDITYSVRFVRDNTGKLQVDISEITANIEYTDSNTY